MDDDILYKWWDNWYEHPEKRIELLSNLPVVKEMKLSKIHMYLIYSLWEDFDYYITSKQVNKERK